ncbi:MAG: hypothetical protein IID63_03040 [candidate division Zixibacteria bacterium]|nr:hypothetical protein [candidate division Zixibacteria bacterium]
MAAKLKKKQNNNSEEFKWPFGRRNYMFFGAAMLSIILGYIALGQGSITLAPILLVLGYCVLVPVSLIIKGDPDQDESEIADREN